MSQTEAILAHLKTGRSLTPIDALNLFGCFRLGARIHDLRKQGFDIETEEEEKDGKRFARYWLAKKEWSGGGEQMELVA